MLGFTYLNSYWFFSFFVFYLFCYFFSFHKKHHYHLHHHRQNCHFLHCFPMRNLHHLNHHLHYHNIFNIFLLFFSLFFLFFGMKYSDSVSPLLFPLYVLCFLWCLFLFLQKILVVFCGNLLSQWWAVYLLICLIFSLINHFLRLTFGILFLLIELILHNN